MNFQDRPAFPAKGFGPAWRKRADMAPAPILRWSRSLLSDDRWRLPCWWAERVRGHSPRSQYRAVLPSGQ